MKSGLFFDFFCVFFRKGGTDGKKGADLRLFRGFFLKIMLQADSFSVGELSYV